jgi:Ca-activated chloride channel homolog
MQNKLSIFSILILAAILMANTESRTITGKITDSWGQSLAGVTIKVKGRSVVALSDYKGNYTITSDERDGVLIFSFSGFITLEEKILDRSVINVNLHREVAALTKTEADSYKKKCESASRSYDMAVPAIAGVNFTKSFQRNYASYNTEGYASVSENGYKNVKKSPLSTFSIDVDNASYSNIRRFINTGEMPPSDAVRIEEMINYFKYDYPEPSGEHPFSVSTELAVCPWNKKHWLLHVGLRGKSIDKSSLPASNFVFLIDVSGSMNNPNKLPLLKSAFGMLVKELRPVDRVSIVVYAGAAGLVLESTPGNRKEEIMSAIDNLHAGGSTAGGAGLKLAYEEAEENFVVGGNNRIILATDGDFNVGESSNGSMERLIEEKRKEGVFITVLGFGMGNVKDDKMEIIADKGNGNYAYIDNLQEARRVLVAEFGGTLFTIAKDVKFQIEFNPARIESYRLIGYENRLLAKEDFNDDRKDAGEMGAGHNVTALYELIPYGTDETIPAVDPLKYQPSDDGERLTYTIMDELLTIKIRYKKPDGVKSLLMVKPVKNYIKPINNASENVRFAAAVAEFGMILRNSEFRGNATLESAAALAKSARGTDEEGYRSELIRMINTVRDMRVVTERTCQPIQSAFP